MKDAALSLASTWGLLAPCINAGHSSCGTARRANVMQALGEKNSSCITQLCLKFLPMSPQAHWHTYCMLCDMQHNEYLVIWLPHKHGSDPPQIGV